MDYRDSTAGDQVRPRCAGCGTSALGPGSAEVRDPSRMAPSDPSAFVCPSCTRRANRSRKHRKRLERAIAAGVTLADVKRAFVGLGVFDLPTDLAGFDDAFGLPPGSTAAAMGA